LSGKEQQTGEARGTTDDDKLFTRRGRFRGAGPAASPFPSRASIDREDAIGHFSARLARKREARARSDRPEYCFF